MKEPYITLGDYASAELIEKKSRFIGHAGHVESEEEASDFINRIRHEYSDARHNVYAYVLREKNTVRFSDDKEPQGSAGLPVLDVLRKNGVTDSVIVVTRYFGGILLGVGGLVRAYSASAALALAAAGTAVCGEYNGYAIKCDYRLYPVIKSELEKSGAVIESTDFAESVILRVFTDARDAAALLEAVTELSSGRAVVTCIGSEYRRVKYSNDRNSD